MDLMLTTEQRDMQAALREYLADTWTSERLRAAADGEAFDHQAWKSLAGLGVFGMALAPDNGGMGLGLADAVIVFEELGRACPDRPAGPLQRADRRGPGEHPFLHDRGGNLSGPAEHPGRARAWPAEGAEMDLMLTTE